MIRIATEADVPQMLAIYAPYVLNTAVTFELEVPTKEEFAARIQNTLCNFPYLVAEDQGEILGYAYADAAFERRAFGYLADLSVYLHPDACGRGAGKRLYGLLEQILERQGYCRVYGLVTEENRGSCDFHEALGYREIARFHNAGKKFGRWYGVVWLKRYFGVANRRCISPDRGMRSTAATF
jgi:phosphinothricin acetyltransferase